MDNMQDNSYRKRVCDAIASLSKKDSAVREEAREFLIAEGRVVLPTLIFHASFFGTSSLHQVRILNVVLEMELEVGDWGRSQLCTLMQNSSHRVQAIATRLLGKLSIDWHRRLVKERLIAREDDVIFLPSSTG
ncbi:MAG: hypothetical protein COA78_09100 [Blastopirellula sp.]|nr:MAG: hypothetical protein COA78_09100 [Blastopirellula sp.]